MTSPEGRPRVEGEGQSKGWYLKMADLEGDSIIGAGGLALCEVCGEPMGPTEQMFKFHGSLGPCPKPPLPRVVKMVSADAYRDWTLFDKSLLFTLESHEAEVIRLTAEVERLRGFAERMISPCEWGPSAFVEEDEGNISDWAVECGVLVERVHPQPCEVEGCECDGSPTLLYFAWSPEAAALAFPTNAPEETDDN